jgi:IgA-specific serine endopeptidase
MSAQAIEVLDAPSKIVELTAVEKGLAELRADLAGVEFDVTTTAGDKAARAARARCVSIRTGADGAYEQWNKPMLAKQREMRAQVATIKSAVLEIEQPIDAQIKAQEAVKAAEKAERDRIEAEKLAAAQGRIDAINSYAIRAATANAAGIQDLHDELAGIEPDLETFGNRAGEAIQARDKALATLVDLHRAAVTREEAARVLAEQQEQLRQAQEAQAERERVAAAALAEQERVAREAREAEAARIAQQRAAEDAERAAAQKRLDEQNAAAAAELKRQQDALEAARRADQERRDAEARAKREAEEAEAAARQAAIDAENARIAAEHEAERKRVQAEADEKARIERQAAEARQRQEEAERAARIAADTKRRNASGLMHTALTLWRAAEQSGDADELQAARQLRDEALAEAE